MSSDFHFPHQHGHHDEMAEVLPNTERFDAVANVFKQLSDPVRCRIFLLLCHSEECVINIAAFMEMSSPAAMVRKRLCILKNIIGRFYRFAGTKIGKNRKTVLSLVSL